MKRIIPILVASIITFYVICAAHTNTAPIRAAPTPTVEPERSVLKYTPEELETLAIIIYQEAGGDNIPDCIREYVGCVVLNRVENPNFPDTIQEVATQKRQWGRLYWTGIEWPERASDPGEAHAVERARACAKKLLEAESRPAPEEVIWCAEFPQGTGTWLHSNGMYFCY